MYLDKTLLRLLNYIKLVLTILDYIKLVLTMQTFDYELAICYCHLIRSDVFFEAS